jgi:N-acetylneuraminic acid mutarotase
MEREAKVVVAGGAHPEALNSVEMYSLASGTWTQLQRMKIHREGASSVVYNNHIFVTGGYVDNPQRTEAIEKLSLNPLDQLIPWENVPAEFPGGFFGHCSVVYKGRLIVMGGSDERGYSDGIFEISLALPHQSTPLASMPQARCYHGAVIFGDKIVIFGGRGNVRANSALSSVVMFDITKREWCPDLAPLPYPVNEMATVKWGDTNVMLIGGVDNQNKRLNKVLMYNIKTQKSHELPEMKFKRKGCAAAVVKDTVIVMGGYDGRNYLKSVESFRFDRFTWEELADMREERYIATAVAC